MGQIVRKALHQFVQGEQKESDEYSERKRVEIEEMKRCMEAKTVEESRQ